MCGRYALTVYIPDLEERFGATLATKFEWKPRYNLPPKSSIPLPIIRLNSKGKREIHPALWGLLPGFVSDPKFRLQYSTFNAKLETLTSSRSFKPSVDHHQWCLVPMSGFYEWYRDVEPSQPIYIHHKSESVVAAAGIFAEWTDKASGEIVTTFSILTRSPNSFMKPIHNRMPVLLPPSDEQPFLDREMSFEEKSKKVLQGIKPSEFEAFPVAREHVNYRKDSEECIQPISQSLASVLKKT